MKNLISCNKFSLLSIALFSLAFACTKPQEDLSHAIEHSVDNLEHEHEKNLLNDEYNNESEQ